MIAFRSPKKSTFLSTNHTLAYYHHHNYFESLFEGPPSYPHMKALKSLIISMAVILGGAQIAQAGAQVASEKDCGTNTMKVGRRSPYWCGLPPIGDSLYQTDKKGTPQPTSQDKGQGGQIPSAPAAGGNQQKGQGTQQNQAKANRRSVSDLFLGDDTGGFFSRRAEPRAEPLLSQRCKYSLMTYRKWDYTALEILTM